MEFLTLMFSDLWIKSYTSGKELKATSKGMRRMKQGTQDNI